jgi:hypothetical protein
MIVAMLAGFGMEAFTGVAMADATAHTTVQVAATAPPATTPAQ